MIEHTIIRVRFPLPSELGGYFEGELISHFDAPHPYQPRSCYSELRGRGLKLDYYSRLMGKKIFVPAAGCEMEIHGEDIDLEGNHSIRLASFGEVKLDKRLCF